MSGDDKQLELEALAAVGEMLLFDQARGNPEEAARILRCARLFARSEDAAQRLSELCNEAGSDATWRENIVEELQDREDLQAAEAAMEARRQAQLVAQADSADTALQTLLTSSPTLALRVTGGGFPLLGDSCSRSTGFLLHRAA